MMRSAAGAIAWEFRRRHRWGLAALALYFVALAAIRITMHVSGREPTFHDAGSFALVIVVPVTATFIYLLAVFTFGFEGDLAARESMYPRRMFTLPVTTGALAAWPMVYGSIASALLWFATRLAVAWPSDLPVPIGWPALLGASLLAWTQALTWTPYPLRGLRVIVTIVWLSLIDAVVLLALDNHASERLMLALLAPNLPLAYVVARAALARARRGDVRDLRAAAGGRRGLDGLPRLSGFRSAARAQVWFEWRRQGRWLPLLVATVLPFELSLLFLFSGTPVLILETLLAVMLTPGFMAGFVGASASRPLPASVATRPLATVSLLAPSLEMTLWSTAAAWMLVGVTVPLGLTLSGTWSIVIERVVRTTGVFGAPRAMMIAIVGGAGLVGWTWKRLVHGLYFGLTGRAWLVKAYAFGSLALLVAVGFLLWLVAPQVVPAWMWDGLPWILAAAATMKISAAGWIVQRLFRDRLVGDRVLVAIAMCWCGAVLGLYGALVWFVDTPFVPHYMLLLVAIIMVPIATASTGPLALAWSRHR